MNKLLKGLLVTALVVGSVNADTNKTFLMPRSAGVNLPMEYTTFNELIQHKNGDFFGAHFQVVPFYMDSTNGSDIGKYFGIKDKSSITLDIAGDINYRWMFHDAATTAATTGTIAFDPELQAYGARIDYYQDLEKILDGLYLKVALPIVHTETEMHPNATRGAGFLTNDFITNYFNGTYGNNSPANTAVLGANAQDKLQYAKIGGSHSETSVADIDVVLGYKIWDKEKFYFALNLGLTIPVGNDPDARWAFEPVVGNGNHWGFGGGLDAMVRLWKKNDQDIKLTIVGNYRYLFSGTEKRTLGLKKADGTKLDWSQYRYLADTTVAKNTQMVIPVANITTQDVKVETGSQLDAIAYFTYNNGGWTVDLGYNMFYKDSEDVSLKNSDLDSTKYYVAHNTLNTATGVANPGVAGGDGDGGGLVTETSIATNVPVVGLLAAGFQVKREHIDTAVAETPSQFTNKIFAGLGYNFKEWEYPMMLGLGGAYEFANDNAIENWQIWGKIGVKF